MRPYLAMVVASRNDDHGGNPLQRTEMAVRRFIWQCENHKLHGEYIVVDWNPPPDRPPLGEVFRGWNLASEFCRVRVLRVPHEIHQAIPYSAKLPLFQMWAKNVGLRRAEAKFLVATNIDVLLSDHLMARIARAELSSKRMYRSDRFDLPNTYSEKRPYSFADSDALQAIMRINRRGSICHIGGLRPEALKFFATRRQKAKNWLREKARLFFRLHRIPLKVRSKYELHTNACGDFTLLSKEAWENLRGYPEIAAYSFHVDSILCAQAHNNGFQELVLPYPEVHFHVDHEDGWSPEASKLLFKRLRDKGIPYLDQELWAYEDFCRLSRPPVLFNSPNWGFGDHAFHEDVF